MYRCCFSFVGWRDGLCSNENQAAFGFLDAELDGIRDSRAGINERFTCFQSDCNHRGFFDEFCDVVELLNTDGSRKLYFCPDGSFGNAGSIGFMALFFAVKVLFDLGLEWVVVGFFGFMIQAAAMILCKPRTPLLYNRKAKIRFWIVVTVQAISGCGLLWITMGGSK